jgi:tetratricopeptide (TPR) repeat protein
MFQKKARGIEMDWVPVNFAKPMSNEELQDYKQTQLPEEQLKEVSGNGGISPKDTLELLEMAYSLMLQARFEEAEDLTSTLLVLIPDYFYLHSLLGTIHLQAVLSENTSGKFSLDAAEDALNKALELNPNDVSTYVNRAEVRLHKADLEGAFENLNQVTIVDPEGKDPYTARAKQFAFEILQALERIQAGENIEDDEDDAPVSAELSSPAP